MRADGAYARQKGQAAVEMAIVIPVLMLMVVAICQVALALNCYLVVTGASRDGARRAAETNDAAEAKKAALSSAGNLPGGQADVEVLFAEGRDKGCPVKVTVTYRVPLLLPGLEHIIPRPSFKRSTTMSLERSQ
jgi:Flp pilus assembly protein TadG